jgi:hypothetical protein
LTQPPRLTLWQFLLLMVFKPWLMKHILIFIYQ